MSRIETLKVKVDELYGEMKPGRADWADWLYEHHVFLVSDKARELAPRFDASPELAEAAGMLHDIADAIMSRFDPTHAKESDRIARTFLNESGFSDEEIAIVVDDAIQHHGCHDTFPATPEGKAMASADAVAHLSTDFYNHALADFHSKNKVIADIQKWALPKIERDFNRKIFSETLKDEVRGDYKRQKTLFTNLGDT